MCAIDTKKIVTMACIALPEALCSPQWSLTQWVVGPIFKDTEAPNMGHQSNTVEITVNEQPVAVSADRLTAKDIKLAAVHHGAIVDEEFVLSIEEENGKPRIIREEEVVVVTDDTRIVAVPNDDYSSEGTS